MATRDSELNVRVTGTDDLSPKLKSLESSIIRTVGTISAALAGIKIGVAPITAAAAFEREMANVAKTTNFASEAFRGAVGPLDILGKGLLDLSLRVDVAATDLAKIAAAAGQQGLGRFGVQGVLQFTDSVSRMASVLDITAEEAAIQVGKIVNIFKKPLSDIEQAISTFNEVSNNSTASGEELLDVVKRIGDAAGSLKLGDSVAIAATALDFGTSPEVAGTAFARVFSVMTEKADEFSKLMGISATSWIERLKTDGVGAFKDFLAQLRKLDAQSQQAAIVKLVGGGRIGALLNKFVQDTTNSVLERNLASAREGEQGVSALREQAKVLNTLDAQAKILRNSLVKLGIDSAQSLLGPLTQYAAQLSAALQDPGVQSFVAAAVKSVGQLIDFFVRATKAIANFGVQYDELGNAIAGTGINFENFLKVLQVFLALKAAEAIGRLASQISFFGVSLKSISKDAKDAAAATTALGAAQKSASGQTAASSAATKASFAAEKLGYAEAEAAVKRRIALVAELAAAEKAAATQRAASAAAQRIADQTAAAAKSVTTGVDLAGSQVSRQREALRAAEAAAAAAQQAQQQALAARLVQAEQQTNQRRLQIEADYQARRKVIVASGTETGLKALRNERVTMLAEEEASYQRSLRSIQSYYARRAATQNAALQAEVVRERAALMQRFQAFDGLVAEQATRQAAATAAAANAAAAATASSAAAARVGALATAAATARAAILNLGLALRTLGTVLVTVGRIAAGAFFWVTVLYSIADALGLIDKLGPTLSKLFNSATDAIGLTSKASRDLKVQQEQALKAISETTAKIEEQTAAYKRNIDVTTGRQRTDTVRADVSQAASTTDPLKQDEAISSLTDKLRGAQAVAEGITNNIADNTREAIKRQEAVILEAQLRIANKQRELQRAIAAAPITPTGKDQLTAAYQKQIDGLERIIKEANAKIVGFQQSLSLTAGDAKKGAEALKDLGNAAASMFTPQSKEALSEFLLPLAKAREQIPKLQEELKATQQKAVESGKDPRDSLAEQEAQLRNANKAVTDLEDKLRKFIATQTAIKGLPPEVVKSYESLYAFLSLDTERLTALITALNSADPTKLTGKDAPQRPTGTTGDNRFNTTKEESQARKLARARLLLARALIQAENDLADEQAKQRLEADQRLFDQGIVAIEDFYKRREKVQQDALQNDINDKVRELAAIEFEIRGAQDEVERTRFNTDKARVQGQIRVLEEQRKALTADNEEARRKAQLEFADKALSESNKLMLDQILPADAKQVFEGSLDELFATYREFLNRLKAEGRSDLAGALVISFNLEAFKKSIQPAEQAISRLFTQLDTLRSRIDLARGDNAITSVQQDQLVTRAIQEQIPLLREQLQIMETQLEALRDRGLAGQEAYKAQAAAIDQTRLRLQQLAAETDKTARAVNESLTGSIDVALQNLFAYGSSLKDVFNSFLLEVAQNVQRLFTRDIAERITQAVGSVGSGGFGGFVQNALRGGQAGVALGSTAATPLWVRNVDLGGLPASNEVGAAIGEEGLLSTIGQSISTFFSNAVSNIKSFLGIADTVSSVADVAGTAADATSAGAKTAEIALLASANTALTTFVATLAGSSAPVSLTLGGLQSASGALVGGFGGLTVALNSAIAALASFSAAASAGAAKAVIAHTGGTIGKTALTARKVNPFVFAGAPRLHGGGVAGLAPGEVPAILQQGEAVLTQNQQSLVAAAMDSGKNSSMSIRNILVTDPDFVPDALNTPAGERVLMTFIRSNRARIKQELN